MQLRNLSVAMAVLTSVSISPIPAQTPGQNHSATVGVTDALPWSGALAAVIRDPATSIDMIVMRRQSATATTLDAALSILNARRTINPKPKGREVTVLDSARMTSGTRDARRSDFLVAILDHLGKSAVSTIGTFGLGQATTVEDTRQPIFR